MTTSGDTPCSPLPRPLQLQLLYERAQTQTCLNAAHASLTVIRVRKSGLVTGSVVEWPAEPPSLSRKAFPGRNPQEFNSVTCHCLSEVGPLLTSDWMSVKCSPNTGNCQPNYVNPEGGSVPSVLSVEAPGNPGEVLFQVGTPEAL